MSRSSKDQLNDLELAAADPSTAMDAVTFALEKSSYRIAKRAGEIAVQLESEQLLAPLESAFHRFCRRGEKSDPGCVAKTVIIDALRTLHFDDEDFFAAACQYSQPEPVWGGSVDAAAELRVLAAFALVEMNSRLALPILVDLLVDDEKTCRAGAARALAATGQPAAKLLLRLKTHLGDPEPQVLGECLTGLLDIAQAEAVPIVAGYLMDASLDNRLEAAIALGSSRQVAALEPLQRQFQAADEHEEKSIVLTAIALLQHDDAIEFVRQQLQSKKVQMAVAAIHALSHVRDKQTVKKHLEPLFNKRQHPDIEAALDEYFGER